MPTNPFNALKGIAGIAATAALVAFSSPSEAQTPNGPAPGSHQDMAMTCMANLVKKGITDPKSMQACMQGATQDPAAAAGRTPAEMKDMLEQRNREMAEAQRKNSSTMNNMYKFIDAQMDLPGIDTETCKGIRKTLDQMHTKAIGDTPERKSTIRKFEKTCHTTYKPGN